VSRVASCFNFLIKLNEKILILSRFVLVTNQSVQAVNGCDEIIFFVTSLNSIFSVSGVKGCITKVFL
jgi:hypothetical protein